MTFRYSSVATRLPAQDLDRARAFYADRLGLEPVDERHGVQLATPPLRLAGERPPIRRPPPRLDEHGDEIRAWLREEA